jgi:two-component system CheB/CheR fusion protein
MKSVLEGRIPIFSLEYPCHSSTEKRWFVMNIAPINQYGYGAVVSHVDISLWHKDEENL